MTDIEKDAWLVLDQKNFLGNNKDPDYINIVESFGMLNEYKDLLFTCSLRLLSLKSGVVSEVQGECFH